MSSSSSSFTSLAIYGPADTTCSSATSVVFGSLVSKAAANSMSCDAITAAVANNLNWNTACQPFDAAFQAISPSNTTVSTLKVTDVVATAMTNSNIIPAPSPVATSMNAMSEDMMMPTGTVTDMSSVMMPMPTSGSSMPGRRDPVSASAPVMNLKISCPAAEQINATTYGTTFFPTASHVSSIFYTDKNCSTSPILALYFKADGSCIPYPSSITNLVAGNKNTIHSVRINVASGTASMFSTSDCSGPETSPPSSSNATSNDPALGACVSDPESGMYTMTLFTMGSMTDEMVTPILAGNNGTMMTATSTMRKTQTALVSGGQRVGVTALLAGMLGAALLAVL